jgi:DNA-binding CsgD family transcriptional regulator
MNHAEQVSRPAETIPGRGRAPYHRWAMATTWALSRSREAIERLAQARLALPDLLAEALPQLRRVIGFDAGGLGLNDPTSNLPVEVVTDSPVFRGFEPRFWQLEFGVPDLNKFAALVQGPRPVGVLSEAASPNSLARSARSDELLGPVGLGGDELRAVLVVEGSCWGSLCLHRSSDAGPFALDEDARWTTAVLSSLALATRAAWTAGPGRPPSLDGPGTLVVSQTGQRQSWTPGAESWLTQLGDRGTTVIHALVGHLGSPATNPSGQHHAVRAHVRTPAGTWVELHGERLSGPRGDIAITLQAAHPANLAPLLMAANGLSSREREVARRVLDGVSTAGIAQGLFISEYTVQDHLRAIFAKVGVRTRRQLMVRLAGGPADP